MDYQLLIFCFFLILGLALSITKDSEELASLGYLDSNCFGGCLNLVIFGGGLIGALYYLISYSITDHWWAFLLAVPFYYIGSFVSTVLSKLMINKVQSDGYDDATTRAGVRKQLGALVIIITYIIYYTVCK